MKKFLLMLICILGISNNVFSQDVVHFEKTGYITKNLTKKLFNDLNLSVGDSIKIKSSTSDHYYFDQNGDTKKISRWYVSTKKQQLYKLSIDNHSKLLIKQRSLTNTKYALMGTSLVAVSIGAFKIADDPTIDQTCYIIGGVAGLGAIVCHILADYNQLKINDSVKAQFTGNSLKVIF